MNDRTDEQPECSDHPDAPHGFNRNASHSLDRYVCDCEGWALDPVAYWNPDESGLMFKEGRSGNWVPLYPKKEWVELTDDDIWDVMCKVDSFMYRTFARALEQKIKEKNS